MYGLGKILNMILHAEFTNYMPLQSFMAWSSLVIELQVLKSMTKMKNLALLI